MRHDWSCQGRAPIQIAPACGCARRDWISRRHVLPFFCRSVLPCVHAPQQRTLRTYPLYVRFVVQRACMTARTRSARTTRLCLDQSTLSREPSTLSLDHCRTAGVRAGVRARGGGTYPILGTLSLDHWTVSADYATPMQRLCNAYATPMQRLTMQSPAAWHYAITCMYAASSGARASRAATGCCAPLPDTAVNELAAFPGISIANPGQVLSASHTSKASNDIQGLPP